MLTDEERKKIYEEEKARLEAREELERKTTSLNAAANPAAPPANATRKGSGLSVTSFILGLLALFPRILTGSAAFSLLTAIPAIIIGHIAVAQNRRGKGMATVGLVLGWVSVVVTVITAAANFAGSASGGAATSTRTPISHEPQLELVSWNWTQTAGGSYVEVRGQVKNISGERLESVEAVVTFSDKSGGFITSSDALIDYNPILPGQTSPFSVMETYNPAMGGARVEFKSLMGGTIPTRHKE